MIRVFIVDDHATVRESLHALLSTYPNLQVVGQAGNGLELLAQLPTTPTDVVLLDFNMPGMNGVETARQLQEHYPAVRILALSMLNDERYIMEMLAAGALGYVLKSDGVPEIVQGIQRVAVGQPYLGTAVGLAALHRVPVDQEEVPVTVITPESTLLSKSEHKVLQLLAQGLTTKEIAEKLFNSARTIETHRQNILVKMQAKNTAVLIRLAMQQGLLDA